MPLAIVSTCLAFHFFTNLLTYGSGDFCWISNGIANLFAFGLPIGVHLCVNVVFFTKTAYSLLKAGQMSRKLRNSSNAKRWEELVVCLKISSVMGFTWALGFIEGATDVKAYSWIFVIINSMQGIFIFMAFGFNHRIRCLLKAKLSKSDTKSLS
ncbi:probable G-protein coupled receptor Mth-like 1 [Amphiura filiformis]|uniref:probable G-protein coupled receptor Mth-like 1 n=1 Tax=Amphiura filiformis TaxID=82378 RepID=UPI003B21DB7B